MKRYYELYKILIIVTTITGIYFRSIEKILGDKWYIKSLKVLFIIPSSLFITYFASHLSFVLYDKSELSTKIYGWVLLTYASLAIFTIASFHLNRNEFERIFELWESLFSEPLFSEERQELLAKNRKLPTRWLLGFGGPSLICCIIYYITFFFNPRKVIPHPTGIPYRHESPDFELVATLYLITSVFGFSLFITYDSMTMVLLSLEEAQFIHLKRSFSRILETFHVTDAGEMVLKIGKNSNVETGSLDSWRVQRAFEEAERNIQIWISHHKQILRFHDELQKIYSYSFSVKYVIFSVIICFCCFLAITGVLDLTDISMTAVFCFNIYATFYINTRYADSTADAAETLFEEAFSKHWYLFPKKLKTAFHIILMRCRRPVQYKILWVYPLNPRSFLKILTSAYSFFTFLLHVNRNKPALQSTGVTSDPIFN